MSTAWFLPLLQLFLLVGKTHQRLFELYFASNFIINAAFLERTLRQGKATSRLVKKTNVHVNFPKIATPAGFF